MSTSKKINPTNLQRQLLTDENPREKTIIVTEYSAIKMSRASFVVFAIVSCLFFPISKIDGQPANPISILNEIKSDTSICQTKSVFSESRFVKNCQGITFLVNKDETLNESENTKFLCLGLYQKIWNICFLDSTSKSTKKNLPQNSTAFDLRVEKSFLNNSTNVETFCKNWKFTNTSEYGKIKGYVMQLDKVLKNPITCMKMCSTYSAQVKPLCAVLASMDEISLELQAGTKQSETQSREGISKNVVANSLTIVDPVQSKGEQNKSKTQNTANKESQFVSTIAEAAPQNIVKSMKPKEQADPTLKKATESQKPETVQPVATKAHIENEPKKAPVEKENSEKAKQDVLQPAITQKKDKTNNDASPPQNSQNPPQTGKGQAAAHDNSQEDIDKNPIAIEQEDEDTDVISQHTQDDDITLDHRPPEDVNEIESPIIPTLEEDMNENPAQAPEKSSFVPQLPGIRDDDDSHFFGYFTVIGVICLAGYVGYYNKQKIFAMVLEGRRSRGGRGRRRPSTANYRKLDCTLEEAVTSQCNSNVTHVIY